MFREKGKHLLWFIILEERIRRLNHENFKVLDHLLHTAKRPGVS